MDRYDLSIQQLHLVALSCPLLASKPEEKEDSVPKLEQLNSLGCMTNRNLLLTEQNLLHMELLLLETFQWNFCLPAAAHFMEYYLSGAVHQTELHDGWPMICLGKKRNSTWPRMQIISWKYLCKLLHVWLLQGLYFVLLLRGSQDCILFLLTPGTF